MLFAYLIYRLIIHFYIIFVFSLGLAMIEGIFQLSLDRVLQHFQTPLSNSSSKILCYASYKTFVIFFRNCNKLTNN